MEQERIDLLVFSMISLFILSVIIIFLFWIFLNKKNFLLKKQKEEQEKYNKEIIDLQIEVRENTLRNISWELHDNIGQMLTFAKIQLQNLDENDTVVEAKETIGKALHEIRQLSKTINPEFIKNISLIDALELEMKRFNRLNSIKSQLIIKGTPFEMSGEVELVLFRILQEFFSNTLKHAQADQLHVSVDFQDPVLQIIAKENGRGFDISNVSQNGIGLSNIEKRGKLIGANVKLTSEINKCSTIDITYQK